MAAPFRRRPALEDQLHAPRHAMDDAVMIDMRLSVDIAAIFAVARLVADADLIAMGWTQPQLDGFRARQLHLTK